MAKMYDLVFITNLPSFYKVNLFNEIAKKKKVFVIFTNEKEKIRNDDFLTGERNFENISLNNHFILLKVIIALKYLVNIKYTKIIFGGLDSFVLWAAAFYSPVSKNGMLIESSIFESTTKGIKAFIKRLFIKRISTIYASGAAQKKLALELNYTNEIRITGGVGIANYIETPSYVAKNAVKNFIFVGRLSEEKNLKLLVDVFNEFENLKLNIVGYGPQLDYLKSIANKNIELHGSMANNKLNDFYQQNDVFILPSKSEPWGLVVEEALNNGLPVILSDRVGCHPEIIKNDKNGIVFNLDDYNGLKKSIIKVQNVQYYNSLRENVCKMNFKTRTIKQVDCYIV
jgi:glycosyltransferase involved in cell wall biosynthesis